MDQVNYKAQKAWKALHFITHVLKKGSRNTRSLAYTSFEYGSTRWDPCREGQINVLDRVQKKAAQFTNHKNDTDWEILAECRTTACLCALFRAYSGEWAW